MPHTKVTFQDDASMKDTPRGPLSSYKEEENTTLAKGFIHDLQQAEYSLPNNSTINVLMSRSYNTEIGAVVFSTILLGLAPPTSPAGTRTPGDTRAGTASCLPMF